MPKDKSILQVFAAGLITIGTLIFIIVSVNTGFFWPGLIILLIGVGLLIFSTRL